MEVIILSGGLGTRLKEKVKNIPKTMAPINNKPFLEYTFSYLEQFPIDRIILAVGYQKEYIKDYFKNQYHNIQILYSEEQKPLGTGGAIQKALEKTIDENIIVLNGDVLSRVNLNQLLENHQKSKAIMTVTLKKMQNVDRFGIVEVNKKNQIIQFKEKQFSKKAYINVGVYVLNRNIFKDFSLGKNFSLEKDYLSPFISKNLHKAYFYDGEFIDIGLPEDYEKAIAYLSRKSR